MYSEKYKNVYCAILIDFWGGGSTPLPPLGVPMLLTFTTEEETLELKQVSLEERNPSQYLQEHWKCENCKLTLRTSFSNAP